MTIPTYFLSCILCSVPFLLPSVIASHLGALVVLSLGKLSCDRLLANGSWHLSGHMRSAPAGIRVIGGTLGAYGDCDRWLRNYNTYKYVYYFSFFRTASIYWTSILTFISMLCKHWNISHFLVNRYHWHAIVATVLLLYLYVLSY